ncbi:hypothetical protein K493DRAFT_386368 [Basidiobolus meristosporus CBS 931.73]|uniref:Yeast cell wall synthesis Kre9/Knh1-like N-terminal domain-containing protein n=1 Tax=Basidiobolus meristosporus CBS 931.73 TaxID=1314790 RepID=A0A1Y1YXH7_9FUNG|nr:hypothetical protein K493DRAFT_386368 [Basidiobolus meristosporus CBS 931.73]|eukprot:ORY02407.1 hypothetical protein K493DRAFT_386368 [Basidiobolus meristosporus CBS 931.73]
MRIQIAAALCLVSFCYGDLYPTTPDGDTVWSVGSKVKIAWQDGDVPPRLASLKPFKIELCTGTDKQQVALQTISNSTKNSILEIEYTVPDVTPYGKIYFLRFTAPNPNRTADPFYFWTTRFTITNTDNPAPSPSTYGTGALATSATSAPNKSPRPERASPATSSQPSITQAASVADVEGSTTPSDGRRLTLSLMIPAFIFIFSAYLI